jgi:peptidoglycan/xylan/chitin deacetylase (PgdA/CDA1 family)
VVGNNKAKIGTCSLHPTPSTLRPDKFVVLTFDDGYKDFNTHAFPILKQYGFSATVFLPTNFVDRRRKLGLKGKEHLTWDEVRELQSKGVTIGSHTVTHSQLRLLKGQEIEFEIKKSKQTIEDEIGKLIQSFSYPYAFPEENMGFKVFIRSILEKYGYENAVSTRIGTVTKAEDKFLLKRIPANSGDDIPLFKAKLDGNYDWIYKPQYLSKILKKTFHLTERVK